MLTSWPAMLASKMEEWKLDRAEMVDLFGTTRDEWMAADLDGWLAPNRMYDGIAPAMSHAMAADDAEVYIVTTKQARPPPPPPAPGLHVATGCLSCIQPHICACDLRLPCHLPVSMPCRMHAHVLRRDTRVSGS